MNIPFDKPSGEAVHLDFSDMRVPYYIRKWFKLSILYVDDTYPWDAVCCIFSPQQVVTVVIIIKSKYEDYLRKWQEDNDDNVIEHCYRRRELFCHETCHLVAIIRAYPSNRSLKEREDFEEKIRRKFAVSINKDQNMISPPFFISGIAPNDSPSDFEKDHFSYEGDNLNYFKLYAELMLSYDKLYEALKRICKNKGENDYIYMDEIVAETLVQPSFFIRFPDKKTEITKILKEGFV